MSETKGAITSKIKHAIKHKTSPARLAQLLQPLLTFCFSLQPIRYPVIGCKLKQYDNEGCDSCATVVQVLQDFLLRPLVGAKYCNLFVRHASPVLYIMYIMYIMCRVQSRAIIRVILSCRGAFALPNSGGLCRIYGTSFVH